MLSYLIVTGICAAIVAGGLYGMHRIDQRIRRKELQVRLAARLQELGGDWTEEPMGYGLSSEHRETAAALR